MYVAFIEPCFGIGHNLSLICQMTSEDIKHQLIIVFVVVLVSRISSANYLPCVLVKTQLPKNGVSTPANLLRGKPESIKNNKASP